MPKTLPALLRAYEYGAAPPRSASTGSAPSDVVGENRRRGSGTSRRRRDAGRTTKDEGNPTDAYVGPSFSSGIEEELGDLLFAIANLSRKLGVEPEAALRRANDKFLTRFSEVERRVTATGQRMQEKSLDELEATWQA